MRQITRRRISFAAIGGIFVSAVTRSYASEIDCTNGWATDTSSDAELTSIAPEDWIQNWERCRGLYKDLVGPLELRRFKDPIYVLLKPISWKPKSLSSNLSPVTAPSGFVTDFASVPRAFWSLFRPDGNYAYAAVLHDYLYWQQDRPKAEADAVFRSAMTDLKILDWQSTILYRAVDLFGSAAWNTNAKLKSAGERRILSKLPTSPDITWGEWKSRANVFAKS